MSRRQKTLYLASYLPSSREGTESFQMQRLRWVERLDTLIWTIDARGGYPAPVLCEQTAAIDDYLAFRPQRRDAVADLIRGEQLQVGPWYVQPLEPLTSAEALVRNLMLGTAASRIWGQPLNVAYLAPVSSHIAQLPQILLGFGIQTAVVQTGLDDPGSEFWWDAPDGSRVLLLRSQAPAEAPVLVEAFESMVTAASSHMADSTSGETVLLLADFPSNGRPVAELIPLLQPSRKSPVIVHNSITSLASRAWQRDAPLRVMQGELNSPKYTPLSPGVFSTRMWLKQQNAEVETLLVHWAEPLAAWVQILEQTDAISRVGLGSGGRLDEPAQLIDHAWSILLRNHSPAAISGASVDAAQQETELLFSHAMEIAEVVAQRSLSHLANSTNTDSVSFEGLITPVIVFNAAQDSRHEVVTCEVELPRSDTGVAVVDGEGVALPVEAEEVTPTSLNGEGTTRKRVRFLARNLPALGYATFGICQAEDRVPKPAADDGLEIANQYFNITFDPSDGTLFLFDKLTGRSFTGLNRFVDNGERGDAYLSAPPLRDTEISIATNTPLRPQRLISPLEQSLHVFQILRLPHGLTSNRDSRLPLAAQFVPISIWTTIRLAAEVPRVDVDVTVANAASDHRLSVHFPTGILTDEGLLDGQFEIARRSIVLRDGVETVDWVEQPSADAWHQGFVTVLGADSGLTIATRGLPQAALAASPYGCEIVITLLRCIGWLNRADLPNRHGSRGPELEIPGAQGVGEFHFAYSIIAHGADPRPAWREARAFRTGPRVAVTHAHGGPLPPAASLIGCHNEEFILSSIKPSQDGGGVVVRGYSVSERPQRVMLTLGVPARYVQFLRLDESPTGAKVKINRRRQITFDVRPAEIATLKLIP